MTDLGRIPAAKAASIPTEGVPLAVDELVGCLVRRPGNTCEVRKEFLRALLESHATLLVALAGAEAALNDAYTLGRFEGEPSAECLRETVGWARDTALSAIRKATAPVKSDAVGIAEGDAP